MTTHDLLETMETLREARYAELDAQLVRDVVAAQADYMANPAEAFKRISQAVEAYLQRRAGG